jgi:hypothetical protein
MSVRAGHEIAHLVKDGLLHSDLWILDALVHVEPHPGPGSSGRPRDQDPMLALPLETFPEEKS